MSTTEIKTKVEQANQFLQLAQDELNRPAEDVVSYMVCRSVRKSIAHYLMGYLLKNNVGFDEQETVDDLLKKCKSVNGDFKSFDLSPLNFTKDYEYTAEIDRMDKCIDLAHETKHLVINELLK